MAFQKKGKNSQRPPSTKPLKRKRDETSADAAPEPLSSLLIGDEDVPDFPRGGASVLSRREEAEARAEAEEEFEREERDPNKSQNGKKKRGTGKSRVEAEDEWGSLFGEGISGKLPRFANRVTLKNISPKMKLLGVIAEVISKDLVISLPGGLRGFVRAEEASDIFSDFEFKEAENDILSSIFHVGQLVSCIVLQVDDDKKDGKGNKRIWLSLRLALLHKGLTLDVVQDGMVLTGYVKSIEDHGYILNFGTSFSGFLPRSNGDVGGIKMKTGQLIQGVVKTVDKARAVVYLNSDTDLVSKSVVKDVKGLSVDLLVPGMMVNARVHATLDNGIMLSFLTYFTGTVDIFHLQNSFPNASWKDDYRPNYKANARILFIDPSTRAIGLTMNRHLVHNNAPPAYVKAGDIYDNARIVRVDRRIGLLLEIPSTGVSSPAYVSRFDVADGEVTKLGKKFKEGSNVRVRVLGLRHLEGLVIGTMKASAFEGSIFTHSDVKPGMLVKAKVIAVESFGAIVQFSSGVKALCPLRHMSEFEIAKPSKKFKIGAELLFRVLGCKSKRITVTHKKTLVKSKLKVVASYADAIEGVVTHGWITKIEENGCFVRFYNGLQGFTPRSELGLEPGGEPSTTFHVEQVIKCRIISSVPASRRINISFVMSSKRVAQDDVAKVGRLVSGVVERLTPGAVIVNVNEYLKGFLLNEHLADHQGHASLMRSLLRPGYKFDQLLVLDVDANNLTLSAKYSLINSSPELPIDVAQIHPHSVVHGYICNLIGTGCFVRFLGRLTGFSPQNKVSDDRIGVISDMFYVGQSVRSHILNADNETGRVTLSLKQSSCFSTNASFIQGYFLLEEKIAELQVSNTENCHLSWVKFFSIGSVVEGEIQETKDYGVVISFKDHSDVIGFISHYHLGGRNVETGSSIKALILDISRTEGLLDLSLKPELVSSGNEGGSECLSSKKKRRREACMSLELHQTVNAVVEIVKENYLVLSVPEYNYDIGFASIIDYNTQKLPRKHFVNGQSVIATVAVLPSPSTSGRLLLLLKSLTEVSETSSSKRAKKKSSYVVGSLVDAEITEIKSLELLLKFGISCRGRVHITEVTDDDCSMESPLNNFKIGQLLTARIVTKAPQSGKSGKRYQWELSLRPSRLAGTNEAQVMADDFDFSVGKPVRGYVVKVDNEWVWLTISPYVMAQLFILDSSCEPSELQDFQKRYVVGQAVCGHVLCLNKEKKLLRLTVCRSSAAYGALPDNDLSRIDYSESPVSSVNGAEHICEGDVVGGRIKKILPGVGGLLVQIGPHLHGQVHFTELTDMWIPEPLSEYKEGQFVKCTVLKISRSTAGFMHVDLSLRASLQGIQYVNSAELDNNMDSIKRRFEKIEDLHPNMDVKGYVKNVSAKGCFIMLSQKIDARVLLSNLSDGYIENPEKEFPVGKLVSGRVLSVEPLSKRVDVTLKTETGSRVSKSDIADFDKLHVGDVISGKIRRTESYGLFITIDHTNMVGLCHISEISDNAVENIETKFRAGDTVVAKILKVEKERRRISLGMKNLSAGDDSVVDTISKDRNDEVIDDRYYIDDPALVMQQDNTLASIQDIYGKQPGGGCPSLAHVESRASVLPLEVVLDDVGGSDFENSISQEDIELNTAIAKKNNKRSKKKEKEEKELKISASEDRLLRKDIPMTADEFEKLVRSSPNSSFVWIKYMAFMLSMADVEKARNIAERALRTINIREEEEKLNIWVAYFNLENEYGSPQEESVKRTFHRALQYLDPKRLHLALLGMYERTEQHVLADELLEKMTKKFKNSCKVWLHRVQNLLKQGKAVQSAVNRALLCLPRNKHIKFISQSAILEFKCGEPDRGRSMFEGVLREYPKRTDLWSIYLDQEIRLGDVDVIRALFERATSLDLHPKKIKFIFKKYLEFEKSQGDEEKVEYVKKAALDYVERKLPQ